MPSYNRPGVYVNESALKAIVTNRPGRTTASFVGQTTRGPLDKPVLIQSWGSFTATFGYISPSYELVYSIYQFFSNGGTECYVIRVLTKSTDANTASSLALLHDTDSLSNLFIPNNSKSLSLLFRAISIDDIASNDKTNIKPLSLAAEEHVLIFETK